MTDIPTAASVAINPHRGEVELVVDDIPKRMRLTMGGLASLEQRLDAHSLLGLAERFEEGKARAAEIIALLATGLAGGGNPMAEEDLSASNIRGGAIGAMSAALDLLAAAFNPEGSSVEK